jgi:hypothetical protein
MSGFKVFILNWVLQMIQGFDTNVDKAVTVLTQDIFAGSMYTMAQGIANVVTPVALTIITIAFLVEFLKITIKMDVLKYEYGLRVFFKLVFAKVAIDISFQLLTAIYATGAEWITSAGATNSSLGSAVGTAIQTIIANMTWYEALGLVSTMGTSFLAIEIAGLIVIVIAYARMFELLIYISVAPLPCAFIPMEESRIPKKYFLSFAGVCLQGLFIIISIKLYQAICTDAIIPAVQSSSALSDISFNMLMGALVLVMAVVKSGSWAKSILDAM